MHIKSQIIYTRIDILNLNQEVDWKIIKQNYQAKINKDNHKQNLNRLLYYMNNVAEI